ncbi:DUF1963 domain-containing protein [Streptomyces sp. NPDC046925]|uniref:DUF1963 domain-containing protein n=1 Tax=Streptomyces sp. NPDC046925 TaxID=3155375 RepID=UPI0033CE48EE
MRPEMLEKLNRFRAKALSRGVPSADVERWLDAARPCITLAPDADGPVVGRLGGPEMIPAGTTGLPERMELVASLDLAALPEGATSLPLPPDGRLLFFGHVDTEEYSATGRAVYVPAGVPVEERRAGHGEEPGQELRLTFDVSLPDNEVLYERAEHPHAAELRRAWSDVRYEDWGLFKGSHLQMDGYSTDPYGEADPITASAILAARAAGEPEGRPAGPWEQQSPEDFALLAQWTGSIDGFVYWTIARKDVAARRFDRVTVLDFFEGPL